MPIAQSNGIEIWYDTIGDPADVPLLLVMGLGAQAISWDTDFCHTLADRGFYVIRFDNRDVGLSTKIETSQIDFAAQFAKAFGGEEIEAPYVPADMAADTAALLDHIGIDSAHVVGASMGGMIAQQFALDHPQRVLTLTSIMSMTGDADVGAPHPDALAVLTRPPAADRASYLDGYVESSRIIGSPAYFDEALAREKGEHAYDRCFYPVGTGRQLLGIMASGSRSERLRNLDIPTLVIHGA